VLSPDHAPGACGMYLILFPVAINGRALLEQARDTGRGLIIIPADESAAVPLPPKMMAVFLEGLSVQ